MTENSPPVQTLAHGPPKTYAGLPGMSGTISSEPARLTAIILSAPNAGKSCLFQDCEDGYILNIECMPTSHPTPKAVIWPSSSSPQEEVTVTVDEIINTVGLLEDLARAKKPRPKTIFIDSLTALERLLYAWVPLHADKLKLANAPCESFNDLHGPAAYDRMYRIILDIILRLKNAGYGVYCAAHIANTIVPLGENQSVFVPQLTIGKGLWKRIFNIFAISAVIKKEQRITTSMVEKTIKGSTRTRKVPVSATRQAHILSVDDLEFKELLKSKVPITDVELPLVGAWDKFISHVQAAQEKFNES